MEHHLRHLSCEIALEAKLSTQRLEAQDGKISAQDRQILEQAQTVVSQRQELEQKVAATDAKAEEVRMASASGDGFRVGKTRFNWHSSNRSAASSGAAVSPGGMKAITLPKRRRVPDWILPN